MLTTFVTRDVGEQMSPIEMLRASSIRSWITHRHSFVLRLGVLSLALSPIMSCSLARSSALWGGDPRSIEASLSACRPSSTWDLNGQPFAAPEVVRCVVARYPYDLLRIGEQGEVHVRFLVDSAGVPDTASIRVVKLVGDREFAEAVLAVTPLIRFAPKTPSAPRPVIVEIPTTFTITH